MATKVGLDPKLTATALRLVDMIMGLCEPDVSAVRSCIITAAESDRAEFLESLMEEYLRNYCHKARLAMSVAVSNAGHLASSVPIMEHAKKEVGIG